MSNIPSVSQVIDDFKNNGSNRYTIFPIKYPKLWEFYEQQLSVFWTVAEVKLTDDITDWDEKLNDNERFFIKNILAFFAASDGIVNENLVLNFYNEVQIPEARNFYAVQMMIEAIHSQQYSLLIDSYVRDKNERYKLRELRIKEYELLFGMYTISFRKTKYRAF